MRGLAIGGALLLSAMTGLQAQNAPAASDLISARIVMEETKALGYAATTDADESGDPRVNTAVDGHKWQIYFYDCDKTGDLEGRLCQSFQFFADNSMPAPVLVQTINRWNKEFRYAKAYIQQANEAGCATPKRSCAARIETDVQMMGTGADPAKTFRAYFAIFKRRADGFRKYIGAD